jgi:hypothetical protein
VPYGDISEQQAALDAQFGASHASTMASSHTLHLYDGSPYDGGVEITGPGYAAVTVANNSGWPAADATASKTRTVTFPDPTDAWDDASCWVLMNGSAITAWDFLDGVLEVDVAGGGPTVDVTLYVPNADNVGS